MLLTIDIGTTTFKTALWDFAGKAISFESALLESDNIDGVKHETSALQWLDAFDKCVKKLKNKKQVQAIVISGNGPSLVPVTGAAQIKDKLFIPADKARLWMDRKAVEYQEEVSALMGGFVDASFFLPKILFIKDKEKQVYDRTKFFLGCPEYLAFALTGEAKSVFPCKGFDRWFWNDEILDKLKLDKEKIPSFIKPGEEFGLLSSAAAKLYGFSENIPVICGGPDFFAAILGSGVKEIGQVCDRTGSSEGINLCTQDYVSDKRLMSYGHPIEPYWNLSGMINTTGKAIQWACSLFNLSFNDFISLAEKSKPGSAELIFHPYLAGERTPLWDPNVKASWHGINLGTSREDFALSVLEGITFAIKDVISVMAEVGQETKQLHLTGGLSQCEFLNQIKADITGLQVLQGFYKDTELLGLLIIGSCAMGRYKSFKEASGVLYRTKTTYEPNVKNKELYNELFNKYRILT